MSSVATELIALAERLHSRGDRLRAHRALARAWKAGDHRAGVVAARLLLSEGRDEAARKAVNAVVSTELDTEAARLELARVAMRAEAYAVAAGLLSDAPQTPPWHHLRLELAHRLGRPDALRQALEALVTHRPVDVSWLCRQVDRMLGEHDPLQALDLLDRIDAETRQRPDVQRRWIQARADAGLLVADVVEDWLVEHPEPRHQALAVGWWVAAGAPDRAESLAAKLCEDGLGDVVVAEWWAHLALWRLDLLEARSRAQAAEALGSRRMGVVWGALAVLEREPSRAVVLLKAHLEGASDDATAWTWLAAAYRVQGQYGAGRDAASRAMAESDPFHLPARIERVLSFLDGGSAAAHLREAVSAEVRGQLTFLDERSGPPGELMHRALAHLGGNRSATPTTVVGGRLQSVTLPGDPRDLARTLQHRIRSWPRQRVDAGFDALLERFVDHPLVLTHRGEVSLWRGELDRAAADLQGALDRDPQTRWAWIGLGATQIIGGDLAAGIDTFARGKATIGFSGPTLFTYRAEAWRLLGERGRAEADLREGLRVTSKRLSTWMHAAELDAEDGDLQPAQALYALIEERLPGLVLDVDGSADDPVGAFLRMRVALRGNRASTLLTWFHRDRLRTAMWSPLPESVRSRFARWWRDGGPI